jgi:hypothetical protein
MKNRTSAILFLIAIAGALFLSLGLSKMNINLLNITPKNSTPADTQENMSYSEGTAVSSDSVLEHSGFVFQNSSGKIEAVELSSGVRVSAVPVGSVPGSCVKYSEYKGDIYMLGGNTLYYFPIGSKKVSKFVKDTVYDYEPMGKYVYLLSDNKGEKRLFRCESDGAHKTMLFDYAVEEFRGYGGWLFMKLRDSDAGQIWKEYNVTTRQDFDHCLPNDAEDVSISSSSIFYIANNEKGEKTLYVRKFSSTDSSSLYSGDIIRYKAGDSGAAILEKNGNSARMVFTNPDGKSTTYAKEFGADDIPDISDTHIFVTQTGGSVVYTPLESENWNELPSELSQYSGDSSKT